jgi:hypothetical protein
MSFVVNAADKQRPLEIGETLCNLDFLDMQGKPFSLYAPGLRYRFFWRNSKPSTTQTPCSQSSPNLHRRKITNLLSG